MKTYTLLDEDRRPYQSDTPGTLGGYRRRKIYGRLDCPSALRVIAKKKGTAEVLVDTSGVVFQAA